MRYEMARASDVLARIKSLLDGGKIKEQAVHDVLNGALINGIYTYQNGNIKNVKTGHVETLSPDRITSFEWPQPKAEKKEPASMPASKTSRKPVMPKSDKKN